MEILHVTAVILLASSYWFQIWKIHVHKEVRDLSIAFYALLSIGFMILAHAAYVEGSTLFVIKNIITAIPAMIILGQIIYHKDDAWDPPETIYLVVNKHNHEECYAFKCRAYAFACLNDIEEPIRDTFHVHEVKITTD